jgi:cytochrome P450
MPPQEQTLDRLWQDGQTVIGAGTETTAWTLSVIIYHVVTNQAIHERLQAELEEVFDGFRKPTCNQLEKLPYLSAVISEGLRLSFGVTTHLQRVSPELPMAFKDWTIPPGVSFRNLILTLSRYP